MDIIGMLRSFFEVVIRVWDKLSGRSKRKLEIERMNLEEQSRQAQIVGDLNALRRIRGQIEDIDRKLSTGSY
jgi:hypothetical protein